MDPPYEKILCSKEGAVELANIFYNHYCENNTNVPAPHSIVISGDLTCKAESGEFDYAEEFIKNLLAKFSLDTNSLLLVPGNHDVSWSADNLDKPEKYSAFRKFYELLFHCKWSHLVPPYIEVDLPTGGGTGGGKGVIFGFNSCSVEDRHWKGMGYIDKNQFTYIDKFFKDKKDYIIRIGALHHHVLPVHNYHPSFKKFDPKIEIDDDKNPPPISLLLNSSQLLKKCRKNQFQAILHGHSHAPYSVTHTNYIDPDFNKEDHVPRSIAIIGCGSPTSVKIEEYKKNHYQYINFKRSSKQTFFINIWSFHTADDQPNVTEMEVSHQITLPGGKAELIISNEVLGILRETLNKIIRKGCSARLLEEDSLNFQSHKIYDQILAETVNWAEGHYNKNFGHAIISRYESDLKIYKHIAIFKYKEDVRNFAYRLDEVSITTECGTKCKSLNIKSRNESPLASRKRDEVYKHSLSGDDQVCLAVPLNSAGATTNAHYVVQFAKARYSVKDEYNQHDQTTIEKISYILEDALRQAEIADVAAKRSQLIQLFNKLRKYRKETIKGANALFNSIVIEIFEHLGLKSFNEAIGIFFPITPASGIAECLAEKGFSSSAKNKMKYVLGKKQGLTGAVIDLRKSDYCINHLALGNRSVILNSETTANCVDDPRTIDDHHLSWVGVPLGRGTAPYNTGALVINISTPIGSEEEHYMWTNYVEPLEIIAELLDPIVEGIWKNHYVSSEGISTR
jgi:hypothetical protein